MCYQLYNIFQTKKGRMKKCYVHLERLPKHMNKKCFVKFDIKNEISSQETLEFDEIKIEEHEDLDDNIYKENVSHSLFYLFSININICILYFVSNTKFSMDLLV